ncbi:MAG: glycosyltransferase family 2 protein [Cyclobacteriaceae bacterium]|nr:glycosyltransferase family 2 protein [Cyclobacteriaceae bacterium]
MPALTLIMPAFNAGQFIRAAIQSLLQQTFTDFELWVLDDGSTDNTRSILDEFTDPRLQRFYFTHNRGRVAVVNECVEKVTSEFFSITDADDFSDTLRLQKQMEVLQHHPDVALCGTSYWAITEGGYPIRKIILSDNAVHIREAILASPQFHGPTTIFRTSCVRMLPEFYRPYFKNMADTDLAARLAEKFNGVNLREPLYYYRIVLHSASRKAFTLQFALTDRIICFLAKQRRAKGADSLQQGDLTELNQFIQNWAARYQVDKSRLYREAAFYHLYWRVLDKAWQNAWKAFSINFWQPRNWLCIGLTTATALVHVVKKTVSRKV